MTKETFDVRKVSSLLYFFFCEMTGRCGEDVFGRCWLVGRDGSKIGILRESRRICERGLPLNGQQQCRGALHVSRTY